MESLRGKRIFVGLSGGVDSAVSAALLQKAGADVTGVFIKGWYPSGMPCTWADDRRDAMRVAAFLRIPFFTLDASTEYKKGVIDYLLSEYAAGRTPNPDVMCNREVKFGAFYDFARAHEVDYIATGHYARTENSDAKQHSTKLQRGLDASKDQSYFLWAVPQDAIAHTLFPVGNMPKTEVRQLAKRFGVPVAEKKDSQGICFLGSISVDEFLRQELHTESGEAVTGDGVKVGEHEGALLYTIGTRIALRNAEEQGPWYVQAKNIQTNTLTVSKTQHVTKNINSLVLREENWFTVPKKDIEYEAQYRYHGPLIGGTYDQSTHTFIPTHTLKESVASGQSLVLYTGDECIGGGIIV